MIQNVSQLGNKILPQQNTLKASGEGFAQTLKQATAEVAKLQQQATHATEDLATGKRQDVTGVLISVEKADIAFRTLMAVRGKLMDAFEELKNMQI